ncbi:Aminoglycoside phosphotransferase [Penicillium italicum]|uniref:Aminoglycoside phosphotransferase n=1 Tax=Penicillium italicum TaxID=40296 RepID=A0A0A2KZ68_PENIT|nr:Aminoglycoside phosphotransferase [Penicillium italicum]
MNTTSAHEATMVQGGTNGQEVTEDQEAMKDQAGTKNQEATKDQEGTVLHSMYGRTVVRLGDNLVVKSGDIRPQEGDALRFIAANTTIPVPKVHDIRWENGKIVALVMDYMPGKRLDEVWDTLDSSQKLSIADELHSYMNQLRELKGDYIGAVGRGKAIMRNISSIEGGPFDTEQQFNEFILGDIVAIAPDVLRHYAKFALMDNHEIVFTHSDFAPRNILVEDGRVTAIVDWEYAGWYPAHWEYCQALRHLRPMHDWPEYLPRILPPKFEREYIGMTFLARVLSH